jgi:hypothetical protein
VPLTFTEDDFVQPEAGVFSESDFADSAPKAEPEESPEKTAKKKRLDSEKKWLRAGGVIAAGLNKAATAGEQLVQGFADIPATIINTPSMVADAISKPLGGPSFPNPVQTGVPIVNLPTSNPKDVADAMDVLAAAGRMAAERLGGNRNAIDEFKDLAGGVSRQPTKAEQVISGAQQAIAQTGSGFTTPENIVALPAGASRPVMAVFGGGMAKEFPEQVSQAAEILGDIEAPIDQKVLAVANPLIAAGMTGSMVKHANKGVDGPTMRDAAKELEQAIKNAKFDTSNVDLAFDPRNPTAGRGKQIVPGQTFEETYAQKIARKRGLVEFKTAPAEQPFKTEIKEAAPGGLKQSVDQDMDALAEKLGQQEVKPVLRPALLVNGKVVDNPKADTHAGIKMLTLAEAKRTGNTDLAMELTLNEPEHVFIDENGNVFNRKQAWKAIGNKGEGELDSQDLPTYGKAKPPTPATAATQPAPVAERKIESFSEGEWGVIQENVLGDLDAFAPARSSGQPNYELQDSFNQFMEHARANAGKQTIGEAWNEFKGDLTPSHARKIQESLKNQGIEIPVKGKKPSTETAKPTASEFPKYPQLPKKADLPEGENPFTLHKQRIEVYEQQIHDWLKGKPENKPIIWSESNGHVRALTRNIGEKPWRVTSFVPNRDGTALMPWGHYEYKTRFEAMRENGGDVAQIHDTMPKRVMDEKEIQGFKEMADIPDKSKLVWYKVADPQRLKERIRGTGYQENFVKDSIGDGKVAFTEAIKDESLEHLTLSKIEQPKAEAPKRPTEPVYSDTYTGERYRYGMVYRPLQIGAQPKGYILLSDLKNPKYPNFGTIDYPFKLTPEEVKAYELDDLGKVSTETAKAAPAAPVPTNPTVGEQAGAVGAKPIEKMKKAEMVSELESLGVPERTITGKKIKNLGVPALRKLLKDRRAQEAKKAEIEAKGEKQTKGRGRRIVIPERPDGITDILDDIAELNGIRGPKGSVGGEYDGWKEVMNSGLARLLRNPNGRTPDIILQGLHKAGKHLRIENESQMYDAISAAMKERSRIAKERGAAEMTEEEMSDNDVAIDPEELKANLDSWDTETTPEKPALTAEASAESFDSVMGKALEMRAAGDGETAIRKFVEDAINEGQLNAENAAEARGIVDLWFRKKEEANPKSLPEVLGELESIRGKSTGFVPAIRLEDGTVIKATGGEGHLELREKYPNQKAEHVFVELKTGEVLSLMEVARKRMAELEAKPEPKVEEKSAAFPHKVGDKVTLSGGGKFHSDITGTIVDIKNDGRILEIMKEGDNYATRITVENYKSVEPAQPKEAYEPKLYSKAIWDGKEVEITSPIREDGTIQIAGDFIGFKNVPVSELTPKPEAKPATPEARQLTAAEKKEWGELTLKARAAREEGGSPLTSEETRRYQELEKLMGAQDLLASSGAEAKPVAVQIRELSERLEKVEDLASSTTKRAYESVHRRDEILKEAKQYEDEAKAIRQKINELTNPTAEQQEFLQGPGSKTAAKSTRPESPETFEGTALKNEVGEYERAVHGFEPASPTERIGMQKSWVEAAQLGDLHGQGIAESLINNPNRGLTAVESAGLLRYKVRLGNKINESAEQTWKAATPEERAMAEIEYKRLSEHLFDLLDAIKKRGEAWGREGRWRQALAYEDFSLETMLAQARSNKNMGEPLTEAQLADVTKKHKEIKDAREAREKSEEKSIKLEYENAMLKLELEAKKDVQPVEPHIRVIADRMKSYFDKRADEALKKIRERQAKGLLFNDPVAIVTGIPTETLLNLADIGVSKILSKGIRGTEMTAEWASEMKSLIGDKIEPFLKRIWDASQEALNKKSAEMSGSKSNTDKVRKLVRDMTPEELRARATSQIKTKLQNEGRRALNKPVQRLVVSLIKSGIHDREQMVDTVYRTLVEIDPSITRVQTMEAISGFGDFKPLSMEEAQVIKRGMVGELQQILKLVYMANKLPPPKTGPQRREMTPKERQFLRAVNEAKFEFQVPVEDPIRQLKSALDARKTHLQNRIEDFNRRLKERDFEKKPRRELKLDKETLELMRLEEAAKQAWREEMIKDRLARRNKMQKIWDGIKTSARASVNLVSSFDLSGLRQAVMANLQNIGRLPFHPVIATKMLVIPIVKMIRAAFSEHQAFKYAEMRKARKNAQNGVDKISKVEYTELDNNVFSKHEEAAYSVFDDWAKKPLKTGSLPKDAALLLPKLLSRGVRGSNRAFNTYLNEVRADLLDEVLRATYRNRPPTPAELELIGNAVNVSTGRGRLNPKVAGAMTALLWAPKLLVSRIQTLTGEPVFYGLFTGKFGINPRARLALAKEYAFAIMGGFLLWQTSRMLSDKTEDDPRSSDYGKIIRGDTRIDPWGGLQQVRVLGARAKAGETVTINGQVRKTNLGNLLLQFTRNKLRPDVAAAWDAFDIYTDRVAPGHSKTAGELVQSVTVPLSLRQFVGLMKEHGIPEAVAIQAFSVFGAGVNQYEEKTNR